MAVQRHTGLQTQGVAGTQAGGLGAQLDQAVPQPGGLLRADEHLVAQRLAGIAGLGHADLMALKRKGIQRILHGLGDGLTAGENGKQLLALGALHGDGGPVGGDVDDGDVELLGNGQQVRQVLVGVGGVDHQQEALLLEAVQVGVVHGAAVLSGDDAVLGHVQVQRIHVAAEHVLQERDAVGAGHQQTAHVGHVKQGAEVAGVQVLGNDAGGVLDGHFPSAEVHHGGASRHMDIVELGAFQFAHLVPSFRIWVYHHGFAVIT